MHAGSGEALEGLIGRTRIIDDVRDYHRRGAILEQIDLADKCPVTLEYPLHLPEACCRRV